MYAIYFIEPATEQRFKCVSSGHWWFVGDVKTPHVDFAAVPPAMAIFVSEDNAAKAIRDRQKSEYRDYYNFTDLDGNPVTVTGQEDYSNYRIVPLIITPDFENATADFRTAAQKKKSP